MIKQITKTERDKYMRAVRSHMRGRSGGRRFIEIENKVYETTGATLNEVHAFQRRMIEQKNSQTSLL